MMLLLGGAFLIFQLYRLAMVRPGKREIFATLLEAKSQISREFG